MDTRELIVNSGESVLAALERSRVVAFEERLPEKVAVYECCDVHYERVLDKQQMGQLIAELQAIYCRMA